MNGTNFDRWDIAGNSHFLAYVLRKMSVKRCFSADETRILVRYKNAWAQDMREVSVNGMVAVEVQKASWKDFIEGAETEMSRARAA